MSDRVDQVRIPSPCSDYSSTSFSVISSQSYSLDLLLLFSRKLISVSCSNYDIRLYFTLILSSFSSMGSAASQRKSTVAVAWIRSTGMPET